MPQVFASQRPYTIYPHNRHTAEMRTITNVFMSFCSFVNSFCHTGMSRIPIPVVHPYSNGCDTDDLENSLCEFSKFSRQSPRSRASTDFGSLLAKKKSSVSTGIAPLEDEGSNILRVTTSVAGKPASQSHPPQVSAVLSDESVPF